MEDTFTLGNVLAESSAGPGLVLFLPLGVAAIAAAIRWFKVVQKTGRIRRLSYRWTLLVVPGFCVVLIAFALKFWAVREVRESSGELLFLLFAGCVYLAITAFFFPWLNLDLRTDALEGGNAAAAMTFNAALFGATLIYAGASIGEGESEIQNFSCAALGASTWLGCWGLVEVLAKPSREITCDRDKASAIRLGAVLVANGLILGRALAGNWVSTGNTVQDFVRLGWPVLILSGAAIILHRCLRPTIANPQPDIVSHGLIPATCIAGAAIVYVLFLGQWQ